MSLFHCHSNNGETWSTQMKPFIVAISLACSSALAQPPLSAGAVVAMTHASEESRGIAYGYFVGVLEAADSPVSCPPTSIPRERLIQQLSEDLEQAPPGIPAVDFLIKDLSLRWPCGPRLAEK